MLLLIKEVKKRPCLWDSSHENYNVQYDVGMAWLEISKQFNVPVNVLKMKWKNLRDTYIRRQKTKHITGKVKPKTSYIIDRLEFLRPASENYEDNNDDAETSDDDYNIKTEVNNDESEHETNDNINDDSSSEVNLKYETNECQIELSLEKSFEDSDACVSNSWHEESTDDEEHELMFLNSLAPFFCKLDPMRKLVLRSRIQDMLLNEVTAQKSLAEQS
ncbi:hypothetical protein evm_005346 [Chilo suppressalis]|nr:hypothetical protein evm_005346 [Chilo suppressalis]